MTNDQTVTQALKPCPMCGAEEQITSNDNGPVYCRKCGLRALSPEHWNTRTAHSGEGRSNGAEVRDEIHDALVRAYSQGANDVHAEWQKHWESGDGYGPPDPDFTESSHDHAASEMPGLGAAIATLSAPQGEVERLREALEPFARLEILAKRTGNVGIYGIPFDRIEKARAALAQPEAGGEHE